MEFNHFAGGTVSTVRMVAELRVTIEVEWVEVGGASNDKHFKGP